MSSNRPCPNLNDVLQGYDPTIDVGYRKQLKVDERMCFVDIIDTEGQGTPRKVRIAHSFNAQLRRVRTTAGSMGAVRAFKTKSLSCSAD